MLQSAQKATEAKPDAPQKPKNKKRIPQKPFNQMTSDEYEAYINGN